LRVPGHHDSRIMTADPSATLAAVAERELLARAQGGDAQAFDGVVRRHLARARVVAMRLMQNVEDADDLVQDAFLRALERIGTFDLERPFDPWFTRVLVNLGLDLLRKRAARGTEPHDVELIADEQTADSHVERAELWQALRGALDRLPARQRLVVSLFEIDGLSTGEVAERVGVSQVTVRWLLHQARQVLREALKGWAE
jgi:RNA polymerase sigma factor (sigma-70 family)